MVFSSQNGQVCVNLSHDAIVTIESGVSSFYPYETGGILIGRYDANFKLATIVKATCSSFDSEHTLFSFKRGVGNILDIIANVQKNISTELHYVGEWHSHPNNLPKPSSTDISQMQLFAKENLCKITSPLLLIVGGSPSNGLLWEFSLHKPKIKPIYLSVI